MKKIYAFLLVVILLFSVLASVACAGPGKESPKPVAALGIDGAGGGGGSCPPIYLPPDPNRKRGR